MFVDIVLSNGWDDVTAALQLLSHLEGDALNVALLVAAPQRASRVGLVDAQTAHYCSPGRLADYQRQFEKTTRTAGEDASIFAIALETLAVKAFGDMGQTARLRLIRDRFIAGHNSCELRRHLDSVPPETPIWDIVDRCRVWESHADSEVRPVSKPGPDTVLEESATPVKLQQDSWGASVSAVDSDSGPVVEIPTEMGDLLIPDCQTYPGPVMDFVGVPRSQEICGFRTFRSAPGFSVSRRAVWLLLVDGNGQEHSGNGGVRS